VLSPEEAAAVADQFGVAEEQVRRDHLISHLLGALSLSHADDLVFFGGTALARTHLPAGRLSEDLDLFALPDRASVVHAVERTLADGVRREFGRLTWQPALSAIGGTDSATVRSGDGLSVRVQLRDPAHFPRWPTERRMLLQRYTDAPAASLTVPTLPAFVAAKTVAWHDRRAPRDLYDLWGLWQIGAITEVAAALFVRLGPTGAPPSPWMFDREPLPLDWERQLGAQTRLSVSPGEALRSVREAWAAL
jgi:predicted nucleotidyltransferase component of viral defense system